MPPTSDPNYPYWTLLGVHRGGVPATTLERSITSTAARGPSGKGLLYRIEKDGNWRGGRLVIGLDESYSELYVRMWVKYEDDFEWGGTTGHGYQKLLEISAWPESLTANRANSYNSRGSAYWLQPNPIHDMYHNAGFDTTHHTMFERGAQPGYVGEATGTDISETEISGIDYESGWHCYENRLKLNSAPLQKHIRDLREKQK